MNSLFETLKRKPEIGKDGHSRLVLAHFNKQELNNLDHAQGGKDVDPDTGLRRYTALGSILRDPRAQKKSLEHARLLFSKGGNAHIGMMKKQGRFGDTEMALIPEHLAHHLDKMIGGKCINPHTKHREYFLGALISGLASLGRAIIPVATRAAGAAARVGAKAATSAAKVGSRAAATAAKVGARTAPLAKNIGKGAVQLAKNAAPVAKQVGKGVMNVAPDLLNGYTQYQQAKNQQEMQMQMMNMMSSMASRESPPEEHHTQQPASNFPSFYSPPPSPDYMQFNPYQNQFNGLGNMNSYPSYNEPQMPPYGFPYGYDNF